jgi:glycosyltransferase involved in cell wall biosynthesis
VPGVAGDLIYGLTAMGHRIEGFFPSAGHQLPARLVDRENFTVHWGTSTWGWDRWYSRTRLGAFASGLVVRAVASLRLRRQILDRQSEDPFDAIYQFSTIESLAVPPALTRSVPLVIHPETHSYGELRWLIAERRLALRCQPWYRFAAIASILLARSVAQRWRIRRASLLVCISGVFRDHLVRDYGFPRANTVVVPNPIRAERFAATPRALQDPPVVLALGRVAVRKGVEDVVSVARALRDRGVPVRIRVVGAGSLWSDYAPLLADLPPETAEYVGSIPAADVPEELLGSDVMLAASKYEPFALTVAEALASGVPVVATSEVGAVENVDRGVTAAVPPGDVDALTDAIVAMIDRLGREPGPIRAHARAEAERLYDAPVVCGQVAAALERLRDGRSDARAPADAVHAGRPAA